MRSKPAAAILRTSYDPPDAANWLSEKTGIVVSVPPYTVHKDAGPGALRVMFDEIIKLLTTTRPMSHAGQ